MNNEFNRQRFRPRPKTCFKNICLSFMAVLFALVLSLPVTGHAGPGPMGAAGESLRVPSFDRGDFSCQVLTGALFSPVSIGSQDIVFNYALANVRLGGVFAAFDHGGGARKSALEGLVELTNAWIFKGCGNYLSGLSLLLRYNLVTAGCPFVPYAQAGVGAVLTDGYKDYSQNAIGNDIEFTPQASLGFHWFIGERWSLDGEVMFQHISNADLDERNGGINALGGLVGVTYYFGGPAR